MDSALSILALSIAAVCFLLAALHSPIRDTLWGIKQRIGTPWAEGKSEMDVNCGTEGDDCEEVR